jgi:hypothetical protein
MPTEVNDVQARARHLVESLCEADQRKDVAAEFPKPVAYDGMAVRWNEKRAMLTVSIFIAGTWWKSATTRQKENFRKTARALADPGIPARYDRAGGDIVFDEARGFYLVRNFQVSGLSAEMFIREVGKLRQVALKWITEWFAEVAQSVHHGDVKEPDSSGR